MMDRYAPGPSAPQGSPQEQQFKVLLQISCGISGQDINPLFITVLSLVKLSVDRFCFLLAGTNTKLVLVEYAELPKRGMLQSVDVTLSIQPSYNCRQANYFSRESTPVNHVLQAYV